MKCWVCGQTLEDDAIRDVCAACVVKWAESVRRAMGARVTREYRSNEERGLVDDEGGHRLADGDL